MLLILGSVGQEFERTRMRAESHLKEASLIRLTTVDLNRSEASHIWPLCFSVCISYKCGQALGQGCGLAGKSPSFYAPATTKADFNQETKAEGLPLWRRIWPSDAVLPRSCSPYGPIALEWGFRLSLYQLCPDIASSWEPRLIAGFQLGYVQRVDSSKLVVKCFCSWEATTDKCRKLPPPSRLLDCGLLQTVMDQRFLCF